MKKMPKSFLCGLYLLAIGLMSRAEGAGTALQASVAFNAIAITTSSQVATEVTPGVTIMDPPALNQPEFIAKLKRLIGQPITRDRLKELLAMVNTQLATSGESFSVASLPEQDISLGQIRVRITRATVGQVTIKNTGAGSFPDDYYRSLLRIKSGDVLVADRLDEEIDWFNRSNPYRNAQVVTQPGKQMGQTDLEVLVTDRRPYSFSVGYDNNGTRITGRDRFTLTAGWGQVFGLDHQLNYSLNANQDFNKFQSHDLRYVIPLPWHHLMNLSVNASRIRPELPAPFDQDGVSSGLSLRYDAPLKKWGAYTHTANVGFDYKRSDNNLLFSQVPVTNTQTAVFQFNLGYSGALKDGSGQTTVNANWVHSPGNMGSNNEDAAFAATRAGATAAYNYWQLELERITQLPKDWKWTLKGNFQKADSNLLGSEQLAGGGVNSVRGFADAIAFGDEGYVIRAELLSPFVQFGAEGKTVLAQGLIFYDEASLRNKRPLIGEAASNHLSSVGVGVRLSLPNNISVRIEAGKQINNDVVGATPENLVHVGVSAVF